MGDQFCLEAALGWGRGAAHTDLFVIRCNGGKTRTKPPVKCPSVRVQPGLAYLALHEDHKVV